MNEIQMLDQAAIERMKNKGTKNKKKTVKSSIRIANRQ